MTEEEYERFKEKCTFHGLKEREIKEWWEEYWRYDKIISNYKFCEIF